MVVVQPRTVVAEVEKKGTDWGDISEAESSELCNISDMNVSLLVVTDMQGKVPLRGAML